jgi:hypothetical protein
MITTAARRAWWPAVGPRLDRGVRPRFPGMRKNCISGASRYGGMAAPRRLRGAPQKPPKRGGRGCLQRRPRWSADGGGTAPKAQCRGRPPNCEKGISAPRRGNAQRTSAVTSSTVHRKHAAAMKNNGGSHREPGQGAARSCERRWKRVLQVEPRCIQGRLLTQRWRRCRVASC